MLGHGVRAAGAADLVPELMKLGIPILTSWQAKDLVDNDHPGYFGSPGIYGQRTANKVLAAADLVLAIGNRLAIWNIGHAGFKPTQRIVMVDVDETEVRKFNGAEWINEDCRTFIEKLISTRLTSWDGWMQECSEWRDLYPWVESPAHDDENGYINSYRFTDGLHRYLAPDEVIVTDMGTALVCAHQVLRLKPPQRLMTSGGLGEMGCALPAAIGASLALGKRRVLCLHCDGGMQLNLQELQTIVHHQLPIKIIVYRNEGYLMLQHTQNGAGMREAGVTPMSGVSFPDYRRLALTFGITAGEIRTWDDYHRLIPGFLSSEGPCLLEYHMRPRQPLVPKVGYKIENGKQVYAAFDEMSPTLELVHG
jgi:acetolactate synthase-1/2/3 large subunit